MGVQCVPNGQLLPCTAAAAAAAHTRAKQPAAAVPTADANAPMRSASAVATCATYQCAPPPATSFFCAGWKLQVDCTAHVQPWRRWGYARLYASWVLWGKGSVFFPMAALLLSNSQLCRKGRDFGLRQLPLQCTSVTEAKTQAPAGLAVYPGD